MIIEPEDINLGRTSKFWLYKHILLQLLVLQYMYSIFYCSIVALPPRGKLPSSGLEIATNTVAFTT